MENQFNWKSFVYNINSRGMVPVIGNDLSMLKLDKSFIGQSDNLEAMVEAGSFDGQYLLINLYQYLAFKLWDIFGKDALPLPVTLNHIVLKLQGYILENEINNAIKNEITSLTDDQVLLQPYRDLIKISGFETFITVNIDNFLERAFVAENRHTNPSFNFSVPFPAIDINSQKDPAIPGIYNLMGNIRGYNFATTDEQSLEYVFELLNGSDVIAKDLFDAIHQKNILFIGSSFPDWFMRFFIRILSKERFRYSLKTKYVACDSTLQDAELITFLETNATKVIPISAKEQDINGNKVYKSSIEFIHEMFAQCDKNGLSKTKEVKYKELIFISYSRDDKSLAERLRNEFEKNGLRVFFDEDTLQTGDLYNQVIRKYIKTCDFFVAIISENAIKDKSRYVYEKEWKSAIVLNNFNGYPNIRPFIIDKTVPTDDRIPEEIRNLNIETNLVFDDLGKTVQKFIKENNLTPIT
ncbi:MAG: TIR domain-containing protein [Bacteroidota bacterium]|nr:TIR domain-containing protein [Bacteroidota bacterium]